jgi:hypothetical protein
MDREKQGKTTTDDETSKSQPIPLGSRKTSQAVPTDDPMSFFRPLEEADRIRWITDRNSDFDSDF